MRNVLLLSFLMSASIENYNYVLIIISKNVMNMYYDYRAELYMSERMAVFWYSKR